MITRSEDYVEYCRDAAQRIRKVEDLAYRGKNTAGITWRVNAAIARELNLSPDDDLVDIGCGDGTLLRLAQESGANAIGLLATEEEVGVVRRLGLRVRQGLTHSLPIANEIPCQLRALIIDVHRISGDRNWMDKAREIIEGIEVAGFRPVKRLKLPPPEAYTRGFGLGGSWIRS